ncbi:ParB/RepB/Spo0J family partition protein [Streptomyces sp. NPDC001714]|uniref:ParB/RepB/Spo0J family partition protein n=1 Tax=Streptomyces sp. NPDC001714 TaxID=3364603 RepID=UPI0036C6E816
MDLSAIGFPESETCGKAADPAALPLSAESRLREALTVPIALLLPGDTPRANGLDHEHVARLVENDGPLPAILVDRRTMRVIDGMHRLMAASLRGQDGIEVEFFDGTPEEAFLCAVEVNVTHGLPLSHADRRAAATRIVLSHPEMSDRAIARASGLGAKTVAKIRRSTDSVPQVNARVGRDGKVRPLSSAEGRRRAAEVMAERPQASLREVARLAGISLATASDVRKRLRPDEADESDAPEDTPLPADGRQGTRRMLRRAESDPESVLVKLRRDPSLRHKSGGRHLLHLLQQHASGLQEWPELAAAVPPHCGDLVAYLARQYADTWRDFAQELGARVQTVPPSAAGGL